ncbi:hypothetical protein HK102_002756 [Quaeritorhiza haematococci]|nr:hypothetical protein HK102_002756 [Quaeritorhiza haematococci]
MEEDSQQESASNASGDGSSNESATVGSEPTAVVTSNAIIDLPAYPFGVRDPLSSSPRSYVQSLHSTNTIGTGIGSEFSSMSRVDPVQPDSSTGLGNTSQAPSILVSTPPTESAASTMERNADNETLQVGSTATFGVRSLGSILKRNNSDTVGSPPAAMVKPGNGSVQEDFLDINKNSPLQSSWWSFGSFGSGNTMRSNRSQSTMRSNRSQNTMRSNTTKSETSEAEAQA